MNDLSTELERLYLLPGQVVYPAEPHRETPGQDAAPLPFNRACLQRSLAQQQRLAIDLVTPAQTTRTLVIALEHGRGWPLIAALCESLQSELDLPTPALAISGRQGYQVWLSLTAPLPLPQARQFLQALLSRYLPDAAEVCCYPALTDESISRIDLVPAYQAATQRWSAFIDPGMGAMFADEQGLEIQPNATGQADILAACKSITPQAFQQALARLESPPLPPAASTPAPEKSNAEPHYTLAGEYAEPEAFLLAVMNDPRCPIAHRIEAAKALLPYRKETPQ